jgi:hypothetical protein
MTPIAAPAATRLQRLNVAAAVLHAAQALGVLLLSNDFALPVSSFFWNREPNGDLDPNRLGRMFDVPVGLAVVGFLALSAVFHAIVALPPGRRIYLSELSVGRNRFRWVEYSLSSTLMVLLIAMVFGISDVAALLGLAGSNASMILFGWLMETMNEPGRPVRWSPFWFGCIAGAVPWIALAIYMAGPGSDTPGFVYGVFVSLFVFFNLFALVQWLQYRGRETGKGRFADYLVGERTYLVLSLTAKSALAWQVFANTLVV